jgi:imidazolonepropionase
MADRADLLVTDCDLLLTLAGPARSRTGAEMGDLGAIEAGGVAIAGDTIVEIGSADELAANFPDAERLDASGGVVMPGFVDPHTHAAFTRVRTAELAQRLEGASYLDILAAGGGIHQTAAAVQAATPEELTQATGDHLTQMLAHGTTTAEVKSGYGLTVDAEQKMLEVLAELHRTHAMDLVPTYLAAHALPPDADRRKFVDAVIKEGLPAMTELAAFCDVYCEAEAFTLDETRKIFVAAREHGYGLKVHAGQFSDLAAAGLAAESGAISADHLEHVSEGQLGQMREARTAAVLLPGPAFYMLRDEYPDARHMVDLGVPIALGSDFNPGSCPCCSMQMVISLACLKLRLTVAEAIVAATINAAYAIGRDEQVGSIEIGKKADLIILNMSDIAELPCRFGVNNVRTVIKAGQVVGPRSD